MQISNAREVIKNTSKPRQKTDNPAGMTDMKHICHLPSHEAPLHTK
jgi:hypothetical protein